MFNNHSQQSQTPRKRGPLFVILLILAIVLLPIQSIIQKQKYTTIQNELIHSLQNPVQQFSQPRKKEKDYQKIIHYLNNKHYVGKWYRNKDRIRTSWSQNILIRDEGKLKMQIQRHLINNNTFYQIKICLYKTDYLDNGYYVLAIPLFQMNCKQTIRKQNYTIFSQEKINITYTQIIGNSHKPTKELQIDFVKFQYLLQDFNSEIVVNISLNTSQFSLGSYLKNQSNIFNNIILSLLISFILNVQLFSVLRINRKIVLGEENPEKYSIVSFILFTIWDFGFMILSFSLSFSKDELFIIYLIPIFLSALVFASLQLRIIMIIYNSRERSEDNQMKFQLLIYCSLLLSYPLLHYIQYSQLLLLFLPLIGIPQIYKTALRGYRINFDLNFYGLFLPRFLILFYLRGFSDNIFQLQPNYTLCTMIFTQLVIILSFMLLQYKFGSRVFFPKSFFPKNPAYFIEQILSIQDGTNQIINCAICLTPINQQGTYYDIQMLNEIGGQYINKILKTPCMHKYHGSCLIKWMSMKMECPTCRKKLPALEH